MMEIPRIEEAGAGLEAYPLEEFGAGQLRAGLDTYAYRNELTVRAACGLGIESAIVPRQFPLAAADEPGGSASSSRSIRSTSTTGAE